MSIVPQSIAQFYQYVLFIFALIELYVIVNFKLMAQIRYGRVVFVLLFILLVSLYVKAHFATLFLYILGVLYLYVCILRLKFGKKNLKH